MKYFPNEDVRNVNGYEGHYQVTSLGRVYSKMTGRFLRPGVSNAGYETVVLCVAQKRETLTIHRLVACAFLGTPESKMDVNHIDGNKRNNRLDNLEWVSRSENIAHAFRTGLSKTNLPKPKKGDEHFNCRPVLRVSIQTGETKQYPSIQSALSDGNYKCPGNISNVLTGRAKSAYGYKWEYVNN